ncbi:hypothetical protein L6164_025001 [Bauhinia variegata]|uniref:Uncharacterized protein n=1 Tax=Bauhinia variegata TaxID=167791 RepID=A0ACB9LZD5_BAUVA|nr:hypothetical protein L6164_025001 [Bauhinia variegata]
MRNGTVGTVHKSENAPWPEMVVVARGGAAVEEDAIAEELFALPTKRCVLRTGALFNSQVRKFDGRSVVLC